MTVILAEKLLETEVTCGGIPLAESGFGQKVTFGRNWE